jgi:uncharacterized protein
LFARQAFFLPVGNGYRFFLFTPAQERTERAVILYLHPFAEELNKTRHLVAEQVRGLAAAGYSILQIDLKGCGDSSHDFGETDWEDWLDDVKQGVDWLRQRSNAPLWLWGLRVGALLAVEAGRRFSLNCSYLLWQPFTSGGLALQQFLRLGIAAEWVGKSGKGNLGELRERLISGKSVEIAGYVVAPGLALGLKEALLAPPANAMTCHWIEVSSARNPQISPADSALIIEWQQAGISISHRIVSGPAFWQTAEIVRVPSLLSATLEALR